MLLVVLRSVCFLGKKNKAVIGREYLLIIFFVAVDTIHHKKKEHSRVLKMMTVGEQIAAASPS